MQFLPCLLFSLRLNLSVIFEDLFGLQERILFEVGCRSIVTQRARHRFVCALRYFGFLLLILSLHLSLDIRWALPLPLLLVPENLRHVRGPLGHRRRHLLRKMRCRRVIKNLLLLDVCLLKLLLVIVSMLEVVVCLEGVCSLADHASSIGLGH